MNQQLAIVIIGTGKMGLDIYNFLDPMYDRLILIGRNEEKIASIQAKWEKKLKRRLRNEIINNEDFDRIKESRVFTTTYEVCAHADYIIECVTEDLLIKKNVFKNIKKYIGETCFYLTNSSSFLPDEIVNDKRLVPYCCGLHFFYPVILSSFIELITTPFTDSNFISNIKNIVSEWNKQLLIEDVQSAFFLNRFFLPLQIWAYKKFEDGYQMQDIDSVIEESVFPEGVFSFFDTVGIDVIAPAIEQYNTMPPINGKAIPLLKKLRKMIDKEELGEKRKKGFYSYPVSEKSISISQEEISILTDEIKILFKETVSEFVKITNYSQNKLITVLEEHIGIKYSHFFQ